MKIAVTGANGQLGSEIKELAGKFPNWEFIYSDVDSLDITDENKVNSFFETNRPDFTVNCAAYTAVDKAETQPELAKLINAVAVKNLARECAKNNTFFIQVSTDYVFDGEANKPYNENQKVNPQSIYGKTKLLGEKMAMEFNPKTVIIRTSWLYSAFGNNFVKTMLQLGQQKSEINVVSDQFGSPTYAADLANAILEIIKTTSENKEAFLPGIYHYANKGTTNWYEFAKSIFKIESIKCKVNPVGSHQYPTLAKRPKYSVLNKSKIQKIFNVTIPFWKDSLELCLEKIKIK